MFHCFDTKKDGTAKLEELKSKGWKIDEEAGYEEAEDYCVYVLYDCERCWEERCDIGETKQTVTKLKDGAKTGKYYDIKHKEQKVHCDCDCHIHCQICGNKASSEQEISCGC